MLVIQVCITLWFLVPVLVVAFRWSENLSSRLNLTAVLGLLTINISFFYLPWLDLSPIKGTLWRDLLDFAPDVVGQILSWRGLETAAHGMERVTQVVGLFELSGWEALFLTSPSVWVFVLVGLLGLVATILTVLLAWPVRHPVVGYSLALCSLFLLCLNISYLPEIEELGERAFPNPFAVAVPLLQVEINWLGPFVMLLGLLLMVVGGLAQTQQPDLTDERGVSKDNGYWEDV